MSRVPHHPRSPWAELDAVAQDVSRWFDAPRRAMHTVVPAVDVTETLDEILLVAELPGLASGDISLEVENQKLTLSGERAEVDLAEGERFHVRERSAGSFRRTFTLPRTVRTEEITAEFDAGLLKVRIPKAAEAKSRRIEIGEAIEA